jgi:hypothetical protein
MVAVVEQAAEEIEAAVIRPSRRIPVRSNQLLGENLLAQVAQSKESFSGKFLYEPFPLNLVPRSFP